MKIPGPFGPEERSLDSSTPVFLFQRTPQERQRRQVLLAPELFFYRDDSLQIENSHTYSIANVHLDRVRQKVLIGQTASDRPQYIERAETGEEIVMNPG